MDQRSSHDCIFIHINKTGGTSISQALDLPFEHRTAIEKICEVGLEFWRQKFTFSIVRNPWDRVVSHYHYRVQTNQTGLRAWSRSFEEWVIRAYGEHDPTLYDKPKMFMPQTNWIVDARGNLAVEFVGRFETLVGDFEDICRRLNRTSVLPHIKRSQHIHYSQYYSKRTKRIVCDAFVADIERFKYRF